MKTSAASLPCRSASSRSKLHDRVVGAGNVAGAAGAGAVGARRGDARLDHLGMAAHAEIVVRAPDGHFARGVLFARRAPQRRSGNATRRVRDRRRRDSALPASVVQSLLRSAADNPSLDDPRHPGRVLFRTAFPISFPRLIATRQRPSSKERPRAAASAPARLERPSRFVHARPRAPAMTCASAKTPRNSLETFLAVRSGRRRFAPRRVTLCPIAPR